MNSTEKDLVLNKYILDNHNKKETPYFLFDKQKIINKYKKFTKNFPDSKVYYAMKANSELEILSILYKEGSGFEVASEYELDILKKIKVNPEKIIYGTAVKPANHIKSFYDYGVRIFSFDTFQELEKIAKIAPKSKVIARMVVNDSGSVFKFSEKFGTEKENITPLLIEAKKLGLEPYGISFHVGSQASNLKAWSRALKKVKSEINKLQKNNINIKTVNIGGGFPCRYASSKNDLKLEDISKSIYKIINTFPYKIDITLEPGRGIIGDTGILVASVIAKVKRKKNTWLFLDAGAYNGLFEAMAYQGSTRYFLTNINKAKNSKKTKFAIAGPTGDSADVITREVLLPLDTDVGDKIVIHNTGAYSIVVSSPFNGFPKPPIYYV